MFISGNKMPQMFVLKKVDNSGLIFFYPVMFKQNNVRFERSTKAWSHIVVAQLNSSGHGAESSVID